MHPRLHFHCLQSRSQESATAGGLNASTPRAAARPPACPSAMPPSCSHLLYPPPSLFLSFCRVGEVGIVHAEMRPLPLALLPLASFLSPETPDRLALIRACSHAGAPALKYQRIRNCADTRHEKPYFPGEEKGVGVGRGEERSVSQLPNCHTCPSMSCVVAQRDK